MAKRVVQGSLTASFDKRSVMVRTIKENFREINHLEELTLSLSLSLSEDDLRFLWKHIKIIGVNLFMLYSLRKFYQFSCKEFYCLPLSVNNSSFVAFRVFYISFIIRDWQIP